MRTRNYILFGIFSIFILYQFLITPNIIIKNDLNGNIVPLIYFKKSILNNIQFPQWNPYINQGIPAVADPLYGIYNPLISVPTLLFNYQLAVKIMYLLAVFISCVTMFLLLKLYKISDTVSILISLTYASSSYLAARINAGHLEKVVSFAFLPLMIFCIIKLVKRKNIIWSAVISLTLALILFSGDIYSTLYFLYILVFIIIYYIFKNKKISYLLVFSILFFFCISAIKLLPMIELESYIYKIKEPFVGNQNLLSIIYNLFLPFDSLYKDILPTQQFISNAFGWWESLSFIGPLSLFAFLYIFKRKSKLYKTEITLFILLIIFFFFLSMPGASINPMKFIIGKVPLLQYFHVPGRIIIFIGILTLLFLGLFFDKIKNRKMSITLLTINLLLTIWFSQTVFLTRQFNKLNSSYNAALDFIGKNNKYKFSAIHEYSQGDLRQDTAINDNILLLQSNYGLFLKNSPGENYNFKGNNKYSDIKPGFIITDKDIANSAPNLIKKYQNGILLYENKNAIPFASIGRAPKEATIDVNKIIVTANSKKKEDLLLLESWYPGWKVYVDGKEKKLLKSRFLATTTSPGKHKYEFIYSSNTFLSGLIISPISLITFAIYILKKTILLKYLEY